jgi:hypothetical protein
MFKKNRHAFLAVLAVAVTCMLWMRPFLWTLHQGDPDGRDFAPVIAGAHCLFNPCNPYDSTAVEQFFHQLTGRDVFIVPEVPVYPPATFVTVSPLLLLKWPAMHLAWTLLGAGSLLAIYIFWILKFELYTSLIAYLPIVFVIQSGIMFPALWVGQPAVLAVAAGAAAVILMVSGSAPVIATLMLALSLALKPQLVLAPALYLLCRRPTLKQAAAAFVLALLAFLLGTALLYSHLHSLSFFARESANMKLALEPGHLSDPSRANPDSLGFLNLQVPLYRLWPNAAAGNLISYAVTLALFLALAYATVGKATFRKRPYTIIAILVLLSLLPAYHRIFDKLLLLLLIPALWELRRCCRTLYWGMTALTFLWIFDQRLAEDISSRATLFPYTPFVEILMCVALLASFTPSSQRAPPPADFL